MFATLLYIYIYIYIYIYCDKQMFYLNNPPLHFFSLLPTYQQFHYTDYIYDYLTNNLTVVLFLLVFYLNYVCYFAIYIYICIVTNKGFILTTPPLPIFFHYYIIITLLHYTIYMTI